VRAGARTLLVLRKGSLQGALIISFSFGITSFSLDFLLYRLTFSNFFKVVLGASAHSPPNTGILQLVETLYGQLIVLPVLRILQRAGLASPGGPVRCRLLTAEQLNALR
jgi:hypothetical protein